MLEGAGWEVAGKAGMGFLMGTQRWWAGDPGPGEGLRATWVQDVPPSREAAPPPPPRAQDCRDPAAPCVGVA